MRNGALAKRILIPILPLLGLMVVSCSAAVNGELGEQGQPDARLSAMETEIAAQGERLASMQEHQSYMATLVWDIAGRVPTRIPGTITATPYVTPTPTPEPGTEAPARQYFPAPDGHLTGIVENGSRLLVSDGVTETELFVSEEISGVSWFPDSQHLAMGGIINPGSIPDLETQLWVIDAQDGGAEVVGEGYQPVVSPDGKRISSLVGIPFADACFVAYSLQIVELDANLETRQVISQGDFAGLPAAGENESFYPIAASGIPASGRWLDAERLVVPMQMTCSEDRSDDGIYYLDVSTREAAKLLDFASAPENLAAFTPGGSAPLQSIHMSSSRLGWATGGLFARSDHLFRTQDGGKTWQEVTPPVSDLLSAPEDSPPANFFLDSEHAWMVYTRSTPDEGRALDVWRTADGGGTWALSPLQCASGFCPLLQPIGLSFTSPEKGWLMLAVDSAMSHVYVELHRTSDGGRSWDALIVPPGDENSGNLHIHSQTGMDFFGADTGLVTFSRGPQEAVIVDWSIDGGETWESQHLPAPDSCPSSECFNGLICKSNDPQLFSATRALLVVECLTDPSNPPGAPLNYLYSTHDRGADWDIRALPGGEIDFIDADVGWAFNGNALYKSSDGGESWVQVADLEWEGRMDFVSPALGWAVGELDGHSQLFKTADGGATWTAVEAQIVR